MDFVLPLYQTYSDLQTILASFALAMSILIITHGHVWLKMKDSTESINENKTLTIGLLRQIWMTPAEPGIQSLT